MLRMRRPQAEMMIAGLTESWRMLEAWDRVMVISASDHSMPGGHLQSLAPESLFLAYFAGIRRGKRQADLWKGFRVPGVGFEAGVLDIAGECFAERTKTLHIEPHVAGTEFPDFENSQIQQPARRVELSAVLRMVRAEKLPTQVDKASRDLDEALVE